VFYGACDRSLLPGGCPLHMQIDWPDPRSLFVSISREGDDRARTGQATVIASVFTPSLALERASEGWVGRGQASEPGKVFGVASRPCSAFRSAPGIWRDRHAEGVRPLDWTPPWNRGWPGAGAVSIRTAVWTRKPLPIEGALALAVTPFIQVREPQG